MIFENLQAQSQNAVRLSLDCKATVGFGDYSRGGTTRDDRQACDHDMGIKDKGIPCGVVDEDWVDLYIEVGQSYKTSDFIVDVLEPTFRRPSAEEIVFLARCAEEAENLDTDVSQVGNLRELLHLEPVDRLKTSLGDNLPTALVSSGIRRRSRAENRVVYEA